MATQKVLVDLDLSQNYIKNLADGVDGDDAVNLGQLEAALLDVQTALPEGGAGLTRTGTGDTAVYDVGQGTGIVVGVDDVSIDSVYLASQIAAQSMQPSDVVGGAGLSATATADTVTLNVGAGLGIAVASNNVGLDVAYLGTQIRNNSLQPDNVTAGNGLAATPGTDSVSIAAVQDPAAGNTLVVSAAGLFVPTPSAATVVDILPTAGETTVDNAAGVFTVGVADQVTDAIAANATAITDEAAARAAADTTLQGNIDTERNRALAAEGALSGRIDQEVTDRIAGDAAVQGEVDAVEGALAQEVIDRTDADTALQGEIDAEETARADGDTALGLRLDGISIVGTGMAVATEAGDNQWTVDVPSIQLANTYTGTGTDSASINADLADNVPPVTGQAGDLYINTGTGDAFINSGLVAPEDWVALATAAAGLNSITAADPSVEITGGGGPAATIKVGQTVQDQIAANASKNVQQDARLDGIDTAQAAQDTAIAANTSKNTEQDGRLDGIDTAQGVQDAAIAANATRNTEQDGRLTAIEGVNTGQDSAISALQTDVATKANKATQVIAGAGLVGGGPLSGDVTLNVAAGSGLGVDETGLWIDSGAAINVTSDGIAVKSGDGLEVGGGDGDTLVVKAGSGISVTAAGVAVNPSAIAGDPALKVHNPATGVDAIAVDSTSQAVSLVLASPEFSQSPAGLAIDLGAYVTAASSVKKFAGPVVLDGTDQVITHNIGNTDYTVTVWGADGCVVTASVCGATATTVTVAGNDGGGTGKVVVVG